MSRIVTLTEFKHMSAVNELITDEIDAYGWDRFFKYRCLESGVAARAIMHACVVECEQAGEYELPNVEHAWPPQSMTLTPPARRVIRRIVREAVEELTVDGVAESYLDGDDASLLRLIELLEDDNGE